MGCVQSDLDPLIVAYVDDLCWQSALAVESIPPILMSLVGIFQVLANTRYPKASRVHIPKSAFNGVRFILSFMMCMWPFFVMCAHVVDHSYDIPPQLLLVPILSAVGWTFATYIQVLELRRFITYRYILKLFALAELIVLLKSVESQVLRQFLKHKSAEPTNAFFGVQCAQVVTAFFLAVLPGIPQPDVNDEWWNVAYMYKKPAKPAIKDVRVSINTPEPAAPIEHPLLIDDDAASLFGEGPLSTNVRLAECGNDLDGSCEHVWTLADFTLFTIRVKWDKKTVWEIKRRHSDFLLLLTYLESEGLTGNQDFSDFLADFTKRPWQSNHAESAMLYRQVKGLNQILTVCVGIEAVKTSSYFRAFLTRGRTMLFGEKFNSMLTIYDFDILACVGKGSFGKVFQVRKKDNGRIFALKVLLKKDIKQDSQIRHMKTERQILGDIVHPFICSLRYAFQSDTKLFLVLDFFSGGELGIHLEKVGKFNEVACRFYCAEMILGLAHLHQHNIVYRDLKPGNILLEADGHVKIADFGLSKKFKKGETKAKTFCGTPVYMAPEIIDRKQYGFPVDWWALGVLMFEMMTGNPPFIETNMRALFKLVLHTEVQYPPDMSPAAKSFIGGLLKKNPDERLGTTGVRAIQEHEFFDGLDWKALYNKGVKVPFVPKPRDDSGRPENVWPELLDEKISSATSVPGTAMPNQKFTAFTFVQPETYDTLKTSLQMEKVDSFPDSDFKSHRIEPDERVSHKASSRQMAVSDFAKRSFQ